MKKFYDVLFRDGIFGKILIWRKKNKENDLNMFKEGKKWFMILVFENMLLLIEYLVYLVI